MSKVLVLALIVAGCVPCAALRLTSPGDDPRRIDRSYIRTYGCADFMEMHTVADMTAWCVERDLGDTVAADVTAGCRPGASASSGGREHFWVCE